MEELKRKKIKFFFKYESDYKVRKVMFVQMFRPKTIAIKLSRNDHEKYHQKYTYKQDILKDKFLQLVLDPKMNLVKPPSKTMFNNTTEEFDNDLYLHHLKCH